MSADLATSKGTQRQCMLEFVRWIGASSPGAQIFEARGLEAAIVPATPLISIPNSVVYASIDALDRSLHKLNAAYAQAEVQAWTVWVPEDDKEVIAMLTDARMAFDGDPAAMEISLAGFEPPDPGDLDWDSQCTPTQCAAINDAAYGTKHAQGWGPAISDPAKQPRMRLYRARVGGEPVCTVGTIDGDGDLGIYLVATKPEHQGNGLMSRLLGQALAEGRDRGLQTSSLQASAAGEPVYKGLGYETIFRWHLYERRTEAPGGAESAAG
jgi:GNAT superfamily N-acetyltransferase